MSLRFSGRFLAVVTVSFLGVLSGVSDCSAQGVTVQAQWSRNGTPLGPYEYFVKGYGTVTVPQGAVWTITVKIERVIPPPGRNFLIKQSNYGGSNTQPWDTGWVLVHAAGTAPANGSEDYLITVTGTYQQGQNPPVQFAPQSTTVMITYPWQISASSGMVA